MHRQIGLESSLKKVSELFKKYATPILSGEEWYVKACCIGSRWHHYTEQSLS